MKKYLFVSLRNNAGKTSLILGLSKLIGGKAGYLKPFGDRLIYKKKRLWDHDANLMREVLQLDDHVEELTIGFEHSKLRYMYEGDAIKDKVLEVFEKASQGKDVMFIEGGENFAEGASVKLDATTLSEWLDCQLVLVASGKPDKIMDDLSLLIRYVDRSKIVGVIFNKVLDVDDFEMTYSEDLKELGIKNLGIIPNESELSRISVRTVSERLMANVMTGQDNLDVKIRTILIGAMSVDEMAKRNLFKKDHTLVITGGDRSDVILASLTNKKTAGIVLTNNVLPAANIVSQVSEAGIPLLSVPQDTFTVAKMIDSLDAVINPQDTDKLEMIQALVSKHVDVSAF